MSTKSDDKTPLADENVKQDATEHTEGATTANQQGGDVDKVNANADEPQDATEVEKAQPAKSEKKTKKSTKSNKGLTKDDLELRKRISSAPNHTIAHIRSILKRNK